MRQVNASPVSRDKRKEGGQMPLSHRECRLRNLQGTQTGSTSQLAQQKALSVCHDGVTRGIILLLTCHLGLRPQKNHYVPLSKCMQNKWARISHTNKKIFIFKSTEDLRQADEKPIHGLVKIQHPTPSGNSQRNRATEGGSGSPVGMKLARVRTGTLLYNLTPRLLFASLNSKKQLKMYIFVILKRFA